MPANGPDEALRFRGQMLDREGRPMRSAICPAGNDAVMATARGRDRRVSTPNEDAKYYAGIATLDMVTHVKMVLSGCFRNNLFCSGHRVKRYLYS